MGHGQGQQHTGRQYLGRPFCKRFAYFDERSFQKLAFENLSDFRPWMFYAASKRDVTKSSGFQKPVDKNFKLCSL